MVYSNVSKGTRSFTTGIGGRDFPEYQKDEDILKDVIKGYQVQASGLYHNSPNDYDLKVCFPDTGTCSPIPYKSPIVDSSGVVITPSVDVVGTTPSLVPKKVKLNVFGLPGVTSLSGETDGTIKVKVKVSLPEFTVYLGDPPGSTGSDATGLNPFGLIDDEVENPDPYEETKFIGSDSDGENIVTPIEYQENIKQAEVDAQVIIEQGSFTTTGIAKNTPLPKNATIPAGFNGVPVYSQWDTRWASKPFDWTSDGKKCGDNSTVSKAGCGPSAVSMVINFWASKGHCNPTTPDIVAKFFADYGGRVCGGGSGLGQVPKEKFKQAFGVVLNSSATDVQVMNALKKGYPCVISGKSYTGYNYKGEKMTGKYDKGHFLCLTGIDAEGRVRVNDSGNNPSGGKAITAFIEGKTPAQSRTATQTAVLYPVSLSSPLA